MRKRSQSKQVELPPHPDHGVYVNYTLDLMEVDVLGLDLDHTLAVYDDLEVNRFAFAETCRNLVELRGYPPSVGDLEYDSSTVVRGLIADIHRGNLVKLDHRDLVCRARSGRHFLGASEIERVYGETPFSGNDCYQIQSPFDLPAGALFSELLHRGSGVGQSDIRNVLSDIVTMLDRSHRYGDLKRRIVAATDMFIEPRPALEDMIARFRAAGKKTFLLTNSGYDYTVDVLEHLLPSFAGRSGWTTSFDAVVVDADKPTYFDTERAVSAESVATSGSAEVSVWSSGDAGALEHFFRVPAGRILYIGDNPAADCVPAAARGWRTALVIPELETAPFPGAPEHDSEGNDDGWGSVLSDTGRLTRFARVVGESAHLFASRVEPILAQGPDAVFRRL